MSTTDKLARALRDIVDMLRANPTNVQSREHIHLGIAANKALAEYDATPAVEVTADAVEVEIAEQLERWLELGGVMDTTLRINLAKWSKHLRALAAAFPVLVQQVERLTQELDRMRWHASDGNAELDRLRADNARLAKDAERYRYIRNVRDYAVICELPGDLYLRMPEQLDAAIDAATAQVKQAEGGK
jgi:hypothetical protein